MKISYLKGVAVYLLYASVHSAAIAGPASLETSQIKALRSVIEVDKAAQLQFAKVKKVADAALNAPPQPITSIVSAQTLESDPRKIDTKESLTDMTEVEALGWAWAVTGDRKYADRARTYLLAWANINRSDGHPINETKFEPLIVGYDLVRDQISESDRTRIDNWLKTKADMAWGSERNRNLNYQSHRIMVVSLIGLTLNDARLTHIGLDGYKAQIQNNIRPDGSSLDFEQRDAMHYHLYDVRPLLTTACAFSKEGEKLLDYKAGSGSSLRAAVDFIIPYTKGEKEHVEFAKSSIKFDKIRANHGQSTYKPHVWNPKLAAPVFTEAACLDSRYSTIAAQLAGKPETAYLDWQSVLNAATRTSTVK